jgi:hypothetical protein
MEDRNSGSSLFGIVDSSRMGLFGHSSGAGVAGTSKRECHLGIGLSICRFAYQYLHFETLINDSGPCYSTSDWFGYSVPVLRVGSKLPQV